MVFQTALAAAQPNSSSQAPDMVAPDYLTRYSESSKPVSLRLFAIERSAGVVGILHAGNRLGDFDALEFLPSHIPSSTRGHASCPFRRPAARRRSASTTSPLRGLGSSRNKFEGRGGEHRSNFLRAPPRKHSLALGSRATRSLCEG
jgi:hypothetical protein